MIDPITLFALANGAVSAVKAGCKLYKDIKGAAGEVKEVLKDLDDQFHKLYPPEKPATVEQRNQYVEEKNRIIVLNKRSGETTGIYTEIGEHLGVYYDNFYKCIAVFEEEEKRSKTEVYTGSDSLGKRALQRVLMKKQLEQMNIELRELMIYQCPPELGSLYTDVETTMRSMGKEQRILVSKQMTNNRLMLLRKKKRLTRLYFDIVLGIGVIIVAGAAGIMFAYVVQDRIEKYPHLGTDWIPSTTTHRAKDIEPKVWIGR